VSRKTPSIFRKNHASLGSVMALDWIGSYSMIPSSNTKVLPLIR
jgi:hypothetical protein